MNEQSEREAIVAFLERTDLETTGPLWARLKIAFWWLFTPQRAHRAGWKVAAKYIRRGDHLKGKSDER